MREDQREPDQGGSQPEQRGRQRGLDKQLQACESQFPRRHRIRIAKLKIGNHALAYLFGHSLSRLLQGPSDIATHGIPELGVPATNTNFYTENYEVMEIDSAYPWPTPQSLPSLVSDRLRQKLTRRRAGSTTAKKHPGMLYSHFSICTNVPNLYPIRSYSINSPLLIDIEGAICNIGHLPSLQEARRLLPGTEEIKQKAIAFHEGLDGSPLVVHIRAGDILDNHNRLYRAIEPELIRETAAQLNRKVAFIGQLEESDLVRQLRQEFPAAIFAYTGSACLDFAIIRQARFLLLSTSTFAWLAAWLSEESQCIVLPRTGLFSPTEAPEINLIDCSDKRFYFIGS